MKQFLINLLGILYLCISLASVITVIVCLICFTNNNFPEWLWLSMPLTILCIAAFPPLDKYFSTNKFMKDLNT